MLLRLSRRFAELVGDPDPHLTAPAADAHLLSQGGIGDVGGIVIELLWCSGPRSNPQAGSGFNRTRHDESFRRLEALSGLLAAIFSPPELPVKKSTSPKGARSPSRSSPIWSAFAAAIALRGKSASS